MVRSRRLRWCPALPGQLSSSVVIVLGLANLIGDGFSLAASNFLGLRAETELQNRIRRVEKRHIENYPEGEKAEIREIFCEKGFLDEDLERAVDIITADKTRWVETMLTDEFGSARERPNAFLAALATFVAFVTVGSIPLVVFLVQWFWPSATDHLYIWSTVLTSVAFFAVGGSQELVRGKAWYVEGAVTLLVGGLAAYLAYLVGDVVGQFLP